MYFIYSVGVDFGSKKSRFSVIDTIDRRLEYYTLEELQKFVEMGITIWNLDQILKHSKSDLTKLLLLSRVDGFVFEYSQYKGVICSYRGSDEVVRIPNGVNSIREIKGSNIRELYLPDSVQSLEYDCCSGLDKLEYVRFPRKPFRIETDAFKDCRSIKSIDLSACYYLGEKAFVQCKSLIEIVSFGNIDRILNNTFANCVSLTEVHFTDNMKVLDDNCFYNTGIKEVVLPKSVGVCCPLSFSVGTKIKVAKGTKFKYEFAMKNIEYY